MADPRRRALVAALLGLAAATVGIAGAGHAYLRQWRRAAAWFSFVLGAGLVLVAVFADPSTATPTSLPPQVTVPVYAVLLASVVDAYRLARRSSGSADGPACPHCGRPVDPDLDFCHWCTRALEADDGGTDPTDLASTRDA
jgi:peptidoglycan/LPS O-acetylase OafA/YrhL